MQLYHSFKEQIDELGDEHLKAELLEIMLKVVNDKPSLAMNEYDNFTIKQHFSWMKKGKYKTSEEPIKQQDSSNG